jgi:acyl carrier protein
METTEIKSKMKEIIAGMFEITPADVQEDKPFKQMANYTSMRALEFLAKLETEFNIIIDPDFLPKMTSVETSMQVVKELTGA